MNKIFLVASREFKTRVQKKTFLLSTIGLPILIFGFYALMIYFQVKTTDNFKVAVSDQSKLFNGKIDDKKSTEVIFSFIDADTAALNKKLNNQLTQYMGSWSDFYNSWKNAYRNDLHIVKYEDLKNNPLETFTKIVEILNWNYSKEQIIAAIQAVEFDKLKNLEDKKGFKEKPTHTKNFFRKGEVGGWRNEITTEQANLLINRHFYTLLELGYIDENGNILV